MLSAHIIFQQATFVFAGTAGRTIGWLFRGEAGDGVQNKYRALDGASIDPPSIKVDSQRDSPSPIMSIPIARPSVWDSSSSLAQPNDGPPMSTSGTRYRHSTASENPCCIVYGRLQQT